MLSADSRLPRWITLHNVTRAEVTVRVDFIVPLTGAYARVTVLSQSNQVIERVDARELASVGAQTSDGTPARGVYPNYLVVAVNGVVDIFEQREANNTLYMSDDPAVWSKLAPTVDMPRAQIRSDSKLQL
jgi:hypothetical protein